MPRIFDEVLKDEEFQKLPFEDKRQVLSHIDKEFSGLELTDQRQVMNALNAGFVLDEDPLGPRAMKESVSEAAHAALEMGGGVIGGMLAARGGPSAIMAGGALGTSGGGAVANNLDQMMGLKKAPPSFKEAGIETLQHLKSGTMAEMGGQITSKALGTVAREGMKTGLDLSERGLAMGVELTPAEVLNSRPFALIEKGLENLPMSSGVMQKFRTKQMEGLLKQRSKLLEEQGSSESIEGIGFRIQERLDEILQKQFKARAEELPALRNRALKAMGSSESYESLGKRADDAIIDYTKRFKEEADKRYSAIDELVAPETPMRIDNVIAEAESLRDELDKVLPTSRDSRVTAIVNDILGLKKPPPDAGPEFDVMGAPIERPEVPDEPPSISFEGFRRNQSVWRKLTRSHDLAQRPGGPRGAQGMSDAEAGAYKRLIKASQRDLENFSEESGGNIKETVSMANAFYGENKQGINSPQFQALSKMAANEPSKVVDFAFKPGNIEEINLLRRVTNPGVFRDMKQKFTSRNILGEGADFSGNTIKQNMERYGEETLANIYEPGELKTLLALSDEAADLDKKIVDEPFFRRLLRTDSEKVVDRIVRPGNTRNIELIRATLGEDGVRNVKEGFAARLFSLKDENVFPAKKFDTEIAKYGKETLDELFSKDELKAIYDFRDVAKAAQRAEDLAGNPSGTARNVITSMGIGGGLVYAIKNPLKTSIILMQPLALAKLYLNPVSRKYIIEGFKVPLEAKVAAPLASKLTAMYLTRERYNREENKESP